MKKIIFVLAIISLLVVACAPQSEKVVVEEERVSLYDVASDDIFTLLSQENFTSMDVSVEGVMLGDSRRDVVDELGSPDNFTRFEGDGLVIENLEYGDIFNSEDAALIYHLENDEVTRITVNDEYNDYLHNETVIEDSKEDIYFLIGTPDDREIMYKFILLKYDDEGFQFVTFRGDEVAFSLVPPGTTDRTINTTAEQEKKYIPYSDEIVFS